MSDVQQPFSDPNHAMNVETAAVPAVGAAATDPEPSAAQSPAGVSANGNVILLPKVDTTTPDFVASIFPMVNSKPNILIGLMPEDGNSK